MLSNNFKEVEMSNIIENLYYGNIEAQELQTDITPKLKEKLKILSNKEEQLRERLTPENLELFNDREEFLYFLTQCYDEITYDTGATVDESKMLRLKSNIISKILRDLDDEDNDLPYSPQLIIKCEIPEFHVESYGWVNLPDDEDDDDVNGLGLQMVTITPENEAFVDECGAIYSFNPQIIYDKKDEYWELIDELEQSVLYEYFTYIKDFYVKLKDKYKPLTESSLKDTLE